MDSIFFCLFERHVSINKLLPVNLIIILEDGCTFYAVKGFGLAVFAVKHTLLLLLKNISDYERKPAFSKSSTV